MCGLFYWVSFKVASLSFSFIDMKQSESKYLSYIYKPPYLKAFLGLADLLRKAVNPSKGTT